MQEASEELVQKVLQTPTLYTTDAAKSEAFNSCKPRRAGAAAGSAKNMEEEEHDLISFYYYGNAVNLKPNI